MATINGKYVLVDKEDLGFDVEITQQPIEKGIDTSDHVQRKARTMSISGTVVGKDASETHRFLVSANDLGKVVQYSGRTTFKGLMSGFSSSRDYTVADGFTFSCTITEVRIATSSSIGKLPTPIKAQAAKIVNSGVKQTKDSKKTKNAKGKTKKTKDSKKTKTTRGKAKAKATVQKVTFKKGSPWAK